MCYKMWKMANQVALFNHKGGVSKTTTSFNLGWMLAEQGHRVVLVDADPQCNLSGLVLGFRGEREFENFYAQETQRNIRAGLAPAFESQPKAIQAVDCVPVAGRDGLFLLPGHIGLSEYEVTLGIAQELSATLQALQNLPGAISYLLELTAAAHKADIVLIDLNPSLSSINQNLLMSSDFFLVPASPDYFSLMAMESLAKVLPRWHAWSERAKSSQVLAEATYPYPKKTPRLLGTVIQKFRPRRGAPTIGFQAWIDSISEKVQTRLYPELERLGMTLKLEDYQAVDGLWPSLCLSQIADFNTLIAKSQDASTPVFALTDAQLGSVGTVLLAEQGKREEFRSDFSDLATKVVNLTSHACCP